jgi:hypothetical protein
MSETRRKFDREFRAGAVRIVRDTGKPIAQVARDLGINAGTLGNSVTKDRAEREGTQGFTTGAPSAFIDMFSSHLGLHPQSPLAPQGSDPAPRPQSVGERRPTEAARRHRETCYELGARRFPAK